MLTVSEDCKEKEKIYSPTSGRAGDRNLDLSQAVRMQSERATTALHAHELLISNCAREVSQQFSAQNGPDMEVQAGPN